VALFDNFQDAHAETEPDHIKDMVFEYHGIDLV